MRRLLGFFAIVAIVIGLALVGATDVAAAQTSTTTTEVPVAPPASTQPMLPTTTNASSMPQTGQDSARLVGIAVSCLLIGYGVCSIGRGVESNTVL